MIKDLFINAVIIIAFLSMEHQIFFHTKLVKGSSTYKPLLGFFGGLLGIVLMLFSLKLTPTVILDFRNIPLIISTLYGGLIPGIITGIIIAGFRIIYFGINPSSMTAAAILVLALAGFYLISKTSLSNWRKWAYCVGFYLAIGSMAFSGLIQDLKLLIDVLFGFCIGTTAIAVFVALYFEYLQRSYLNFIQVKKESRRDHLTGLYNARQFHRLYKFLVDYIQGHKSEISLLLIDIDFFKHVNDTYGHAEGDLVLKEFAKILKCACRNNDFIFRIGGDEFSVLLSNCTTTGALDVAERIRSSVENHPFVLTSSELIKLTISIGIASDSGVGSPEMFFKQADDALYEAKRSRNRVVYSTCIDHQDVQLASENGTRDQGGNLQVKSLVFPLSWPQFGRTQRLFKKARGFLN